METLKDELAEAIERSFQEEVRRYAAQLREILEPERDAADARAKTLAEASDRLDELEARRASLAESIG